MVNFPIWYITRVVSFLEDLRGTVIQVQRSLFLFQLPSQGVSSRDVRHVADQRWTSPLNFAEAPLSATELGRMGGFVVAFARDSNSNSSLITILGRLYWSRVDISPTTLWNAEPRPSGMCLQHLCFVASPAYTSCGQRHLSRLSHWCWGKRHAPCETL